MNLNEVRSFLVLAEQLHFGRTARLLHMSQPALTKQIRRLEEELGGALLVRARRVAQLSSLGRDFFERARVLVRDWDQLIARSQRMRSWRKRALAFGLWLSHFRNRPASHCTVAQKAPRRGGVPSRHVHLGASGGLAGRQTRSRIYPAYRHQEVD